MNANDIKKQAADLQSQARKMNRLIKPLLHVEASAHGTFGLPALPPRVATKKADLSGLPGQIIDWVNDRKLTSSEAQVLAAFCSEYARNGNRPIGAGFMNNVDRDSLVQKQFVTSVAGLFGVTCYVPAPHARDALASHKPANKAEGTPDFSRSADRLNAQIGLRRK